MYYWALRDVLKSVFAKLAFIFILPLQTLGSASLLINELTFVCLFEFAQIILHCYHCGV